MTAFVDDIREILGKLSEKETKVPLVISQQVPESSEPVAVQTPFQLSISKEEKGQTVASFIRLTGLDDAGAVHGDRWPVMRQQAIALAHKEIHRLATKKTVIEEVGEGAWLVCFQGAADEHGPKEATKHMSSEIRSSLYRAMPEVDVKVDRFVQTLEGDLPPDAATLYDSLRAVAPTPEEQARAEEAAVLSRCRAFYRPFWTPMTGRTGPNSISIETPTEIKRRLKKSTDPETSTDILAGLDREHLVRTLEYLARSGNLRNRPDIIVPVRARTLLSERQAPLYLKAAAASQDIIKSALYFEIIEAPTNAESFAALAASGSIAGLKLLGARLILQLPAPELAPASSMLKSLYGVSILLGPKLDARRLSMGLRRLTAQAEAVELQTFIHHANSMAYAKAAAEARCTWIAGSAVQDVSENPRLEHPFNSFGFRPSYAA